ncbi:hypothetical protein C8F04DRAFT_969214 [Mycena alexandri]|uniref:Uncharacterized protein n=1 Tax=Mycena alexandri TaxID=1745969 RepID=A0AAD6SB26_9AGAR|nr:hypothetical protein C8F04DRAFT_969214 [Mycena alexandri]
MTTWFPEGYTYPPVFFPPGPPPLSAATSNPNPPPWRGYRKGSNASGKPSSSQTSSTPSQRNTHASHPQLDLVDGVDYFMIGEKVRVRRWYAATDSFTPWYMGEVVRPVIVENNDGTQRRAYSCIYEHPANPVPLEKLFSPHFQEITSLEADPVSATPVLRLGKDSKLVFAPIPVADLSGNKRVVYSPAIVLVRALSSIFERTNSKTFLFGLQTTPNEQGGVRLRVLAGPAAKREIGNFAFKHAPPYTAESAQILRQKGFRVEGDGINRSF